MYPSFRILVVASKSDLRKQIKSILDSERYIVETEKTAKAAKVRLAEQQFDLVICQEKLQDQSGFRLYRKYEEHFIQYNTAFFLVLEDINIEDLQLGLELGLDNFIFTPVNGGALLNKVEKHLKKSLQFNYYETERFRMQFHTSPVAMFFSENMEITEYNNSFNRVFSKYFVEQKTIEFHNLFEINGHQQNRMLLRKLENGLIDHCWLEDVKQAVEPHLKFSLYKSSIGSRDKNKFLTIILPACHYNNQDNSSLDCPVYGTCLKNSSEGKIKEIEAINLTPREVEVFKLSAGGFPIKQIAAKLNLSERTVEKHRSNIMSKAEARSMMEAIFQIQKQQFLQDR